MKVYAGQPTKAGQIIIRQRGSKYRAGTNVRIGADDTLYASQPGIVQFTRRKIRSFTGSLKRQTIVSVDAAQE